MPAGIFFELSPEKRERIISVCIAEFSKYGYETSSTNRIIAASGISKGSLFKYFESKEELYLYILELTASEMIADLSNAAACLSDDIFTKAAEYSALEFSWYAEHPEKAKLIINAFTKSDTDIYRRISEKYAGRDDDIYYDLFRNVDSSRFYHDKQKTIDIFKWFMKGFNNDFNEKIKFGSTIEIEEAKNSYLKQLTVHMNILRSALIKPQEV